MWKFRFNSQKKRKQDSRTELDSAPLMRIFLSRTNKMDLKTYLNEKRSIVETALLDCLPEPDGPAAEVVRSMRYSLFAGGKRLRPILCLAGADAIHNRKRFLLAG